MQAVPGGKDRQRILEQVRGELGLGFLHSLVGAQCDSENAAPLMGSIPNLSFLLASAGQGTSQASAAATQKIMGKKKRSCAIPFPKNKDS